MKNRTCGQSASGNENTALLYRRRYSQRSRNRNEPRSVITYIFVNMNSGNNPGSRDRIARYYVRRGRSTLPVQCDMVQFTAGLPEADIEINRVRIICSEECSDY